MPNANKLVFEREGTTYVLSEVFTNDSSRARGPRDASR